MPKFPSAAAWLAAGLLALGLASAAPPGPAPATTPTLRFAVVHTASARTLQSLLYAGGRFEPAETAFSAFLVQHGDDLFLFDSGLGRAVDAQFDADMPLWARPFFRYERPARPARDQLDAAGIGPIRRIIVSHGHWDHLSGIADFPQAEVWLAPAELALAQSPSRRVGAVWPSQVAAAPQWREIVFDGPAFEGFEASHDLYRDGRAVLVPMAGHTAGSVGLFLRLDSGQRYFLVGDLVWHAGALASGAPKQWLARRLVDQDADGTQAAIARIRAAMARDPALVVVPAHDAQRQSTLPRFPDWVQ